MRRNAREALVELTGASRTKATFSAPSGAMALPPERRRRQRVALEPLEVTPSSAASDGSSSGSGRGDASPKAAASRGTMCPTCHSAIRKVAREGKPPGCNCTCMYCLAYGHPVKVCPRKAAQMSQMDAVAAAAPERAAAARAVARAADSQRSLAREWHKAKATEQSVLAQAELDASGERAALVDLAAELQVSREEIFERFRLQLAKSERAARATGAFDDKDRLQFRKDELAKLQEGLADERERARQYRMTVATIYRATTPDRPSTPGTVFADAVDTLRRDKHFREHAKKRADAAGRPKSGGAPSGTATQKKRPSAAAAKAKQENKSGVVYTANVEDGGIPLSYAEMLGGLGQRPSASRRLRRWGAAQRRRAISGLMAGPRQLSKAGSALVVAVAAMKKERLLVEPKSTVAEPTDQQLATFVGMGYSDDKLARRAFALADGDFDRAISLIELWSAPLTLTLVERGESEDRTVKMDLPAVKNHGEVFLGTDESCDGRFLANSYTNRLHARVKIGPVPGGHCDLGRQAHGHGDYLMHIIDNRSKWGLFVNGIRVLGCANITHGDVIILGWRAAAKTRRSQPYGPGFHRSDIKLKVEMSSAAVYTEEQHVGPTALLVASRKEFLKHEARQRTVTLYGGASELRVPANHMAASPTKWAGGETKQLGALDLLPENFDEERRNKHGPRARKELQLGRPLTPAERHELTVGNQLPASEIKAAIEVGLKVGRSEAVAEVAEQLYADVLDQTAETQRLEEAAEAARQQALLEAEHAAAAEEWRQWRESELSVAQMAPKDRPSTPEVTKLLEKWGDVELDTSQLGPLYR